MAEGKLKKANSFNTESVRFLMFLVGSYYFLQGMSGNRGLHDQALQFYLTKTQGFSAAQLADFRFLITIPWMLKPLYGIIADTVPIFGYRIKSYFFLSVTLTVSAYLLVNQWGYSPSMLSKFLIISAVGVAFSDVLCDKLMVVKGQPLNATDRLQASQWFSIAAAGAIIAFSGGYIAEHISLQNAVLFSLIFTLMVIPATLTWKEKKVASSRNSASEAWYVLKNACRSKPLWGCAVFLFLFNLSPSLQSTLYIYETKILNFSQVFIGYVNTVENIGFLIATFVFGLVCKKFSEEWLLRGIVISGAFTTLAYVFFIGPKSAFAITFATSVISVVAFLGILTLAARVCPRDAEGTVFALLMSIINFSQQLGNQIGGRLFDKIGFKWLVVISAATTAIMWFFLPLVRQKK